MNKKIMLECSRCKRRNYSIIISKKCNSLRIMFRKYCKFCKAHIVHKKVK